MGHAIEAIKSPAMMPARPWKGLAALPEASAPSASLDRLKAQAAPTMRPPYLPPCRHGECVAVGCVVEADLSLRMGNESLSREKIERIAAG